MRRFLLASAALLLSASALAGPLDVSAPSNVQSVAAIAPAAQKVYPPLPSLAMLPAASNDDDDAPVVRTIAKKSRKTARHVVEARPLAPEPRLVVSDESRVYLKDVESKLDAALAR
jgi:hypothetical protein